MSKNNQSLVLSSITKEMTLTEESVHNSIDKGFNSALGNRAKEKMAK